MGVGLVAEQTMYWEERWHPLREEWVIVAAHRQDRPWSGETIQHGEGALPEYLPDCYLCPRNLRVSGKRRLGCIVGVRVKIERKLLKD